MPLTILITGSEGFLGSNLVSTISNSKYEIIGTSLRDSSNQNGDFKYESGDLTNPEFPKYLIRKYNPDIIINTVAWTDVDGCEEAPEKANGINVQTIVNIINAIDNDNIKLIQISTDQLFSGHKINYSETDTTKPLNEYAKTKLMAEHACLKYKNSVVVRTNFFGCSPKGHNDTFAEWIYNSLSNNIPLTLFTDLFFSPIEVSCLVESLFPIFNSRFNGIINIAGTNRISKYEFGHKLAKKFNIDGKLIRAGSMYNFNFIGKRQSDLSLSISKYKSLFNYQLPGINKGLTIFKKNIFDNKDQN